MPIRPQAALPGEEWLKVSHEPIEGVTSPSAGGNGGSDHFLQLDRGIIKDNGVHV
jgi:hypothetical protein